MSNPKLNQPDVEPTITTIGESITINKTMPTKQFNKIFVTGMSVEDQQTIEPTLDECIKKWEEKGYVYKKIFCISLINKKKRIEIFLCEPDKDCNEWMYTLKGYLTMSEHLLLTKTIKALEVENAQKK